KGTAATSDDLPADLRGGTRKTRSVRLQVTQAGAMGWHLQFHQAGLKVRAGHSYTLTFWARADKPRTISAFVGQAHAPWKVLGCGTQVSLTAEWKQFRFVFALSTADDNARVVFGDLARQKGTVWLAGISFRPGGTIGLTPEERLEKSSVAL